MNTLQNKARLDLMERQDLMVEVRRQQNILDRRGDNLTAKGRVILEASIKQKLAKVEALRTGRPVTGSVTIERSRAI